VCGVVSAADTFRALWDENIHQAFVCFVDRESLYNLANKSK